MPTKNISRDEYDVTIAELADRQERREGDAVLITGCHEDYGRTTLKREAGACTLEADLLD